MGLRIQTYYILASSPLKNEEVANDARKKLDIINDTMPKDEVIGYVYDLKYKRNMIVLSTIAKSRWQVHDASIHTSNLPNKFF